MRSSPFKLRTLGGSRLRRRPAGGGRLFEQRQRQQRQQQQQFWHGDRGRGVQPADHRPDDPADQSNFEKQYPGIKVKFATYTEGDLRAAIEKDVSTHSNSFNVIMIGPYETPLFAKNGWLTNLSTQYIAK